MNKSIRTALAALGLAATLLGCSSKPNTTALGHVDLRLTDAPGQFEAVNLVVTSVAIHRAGSGWETIKQDTTTYDLLALREGVFASLAAGDVPAGHYTQIRLVIGEGSNVVQASTSYPIEIPSGMQSGFKLVGEFDVPAAGAVELTLDFDAARSIVQTGQGSYQLKPTVRVVVNDLIGQITGHLLPEGTAATVFALQGPDTLQSTVAHPDGRFTLGALAAGSYQVAIHPAQGYRDTTLGGVSVSAGQTTDVGDVTLTPQ